MKRFLKYHQRFLPPLAIDDHADAHFARVNHADVDAALRQAPNIRRATPVCVRMPMPSTRS